MASTTWEDIQQYINRGIVPYDQTLQPVLLFLIERVRMLEAEVAKFQASAQEAHAEELLILNDNNEAEADRTRDPLTKRPYNRHS
jgi:hypothetical protein